jgi:hypothetical protein
MTERFDPSVFPTLSNPMSIPRTTAELSTKWPVYSKVGPEVNPDAPAIVAYKN